MLTSIRSYLQIEKHIIYLILAELCLQFINASFFLLLNFYMQKNGYPDYRIADFISYRFLAVMLFAFPLGLFIKGRKLKPLFYVSAFTTPFISFLIIYAVQLQLDSLLYFSLILWGVGFTCLQVTSLPFILLNARKETHPEAIALFFQTWSVSTLICGVIIFFLSRNLPQWADEQTLLISFSFVGLLSIYFISQIKIDEKVSDKIPMRDFFTGYDWKPIITVIVPTMIIAVGAGFTIPFVNLFFYNVFDIDSDVYSLLGSFAYLLVAMGILFSPFVRRKFGYKIAITLIQSLAIIALIIMATTEYYKEMWFAVYVAVFFFIIRQPLMNIAGPMTSELTMYYVGRRNREIVSALNASIWSGSWFISSQIFRILRSSGMSYAGIFLITASLYAVGVIWYYFLIRDFQKKENKGLIES